MIIYVNDKWEIHDVGKTDNKSLRSVYVNENSPKFPFKNCSTAKICCYAVAVTNGEITGSWPYVDSRLIPEIDQMGHQIDSVMPWTRTIEASKGDTEVQFDNVPDGNGVIRIKDSEDNFISVIDIKRNGDLITVIFPELEYAADVVLTIN